MRRILALAFLLFLSSHASAATYYYTYNNQNYSSGQAVCNAYKAAFQASYPSTPLTVTVTVTNSNGNVKCTTKVASNGATMTTNDFGRLGSDCGTNGTWNNTTAQCDYPPPEPDCSSKKGTSGPFSKSGSAPDGYMTLTKGMAAPAQSGCFNGCLANTADQKCKTLTSGIYACRGTAWYTGDSCGSSSAPSVDTSDGSPSPPPEKKSETKPCVYTTAADGKQTCTSSKSDEQEGQSCGAAAGCTSTKPSKSDTTVTTEVTKVTNSGGGTTSTKTDTATQTKCTGMKECQSGSTTTTTTTTTDKDGNTTGSSTTCKGSSCADKNTNPDGDGDGLGDCIENCGNGEGGATTMPELEDVDDYGTSFKKFYDRLANSPIAKSVGRLSIAESSSCPVYSADLGYAGHQNTSFFCQFASDLFLPIRVLFLACWAWVAIRLFMTA